MPDGIAWNPSNHDGFVYYEVFSGGVSVATAASTSLSFTELIRERGTVYIGDN
ncbi:hypothetical protein [Kribbella catacumbae]|uniref:hypothetical protein n=1 Tax=Kribbella catacumbae TaxID=460086 RepID=UPI00146EDDF3|nr:hypothetical protein [Kribbella catacumbae]